MRTITAWLAAAGFVPATRAEPPPKPEALARAEAARSQSALFTARLETSVREPDSDPNQPPTRRFFTWRCAGAEYLVVHHGNEDGEVMPWRDFDGTPIRSPRVYDPRHNLFLDGQVWLNAASEPKAEVRPGEARSSYDLFDWRQVGLNPVSLDRSWDATVQESIDQGAPPPEYSVRVEESLQIVTARAGKRSNLVDRPAARLGGGSNRIRARREADVRAAHYAPRVRRLLVSRAGRGGGSGRRGERPWCVWEVLYAEFNRPTHPQELGPADIGVEPGRPVRVFEAQDAPPQRAYWDGSSLVSADEFSQRVRAGERFEGPTLVRERTRNAARIERLQQLAKRGLIDPSALPPPLAARLAGRGAREVRSFETVWEKYTREFIRRHKLDNEQTQKAWSICRECQELAREYVSRKREDIEKLEKRLADLPASPTPRPAADATERELADLVRPIERIFEDQLKPRLDALPTREQRQRASDSGKSQTVP